MDRYTLLKKIGSGTYGIVYMARDKLNECHVAIKVFKNVKDVIINPSDLRELSLLKKLSLYKHINILKLIDVIVEYQNKPTIAMVLEYMDCDLSTVITQDHTMEMSQIYNIMKQLLNAVKFLHSNAIIHRDIKPRNILINRDDGCLKLADFGLSKFSIFSTNTLSRLVVTLWYRAPELLISKIYDEKIDIWSIGCVFVELINGSALFPGDSDIEQINKIFNIIPLPNITEWPSDSIINYESFIGIQEYDLFACIQSNDSHLIKFIEKFLLFKPKDRISCKNALPYFNLKKEKPNAK